MLVVPAGLQNEENTCYLNVVVQCLNAIPELREELASYRVSQPNGPGNITVELREVLQQLSISGDGQSISTSSLLKELRSTFSQFSEEKNGNFLPQVSESKITSF